MVSPEGRAVVRIRICSASPPVARSSHARRSLAGSSAGSLAHDHYATKGTIVLTLIFLACFAVYYFANWKALADVWPVR